MPIGGRTVSPAFATVCFSAHRRLRISSGSQFQTAKLTPDPDGAHQKFAGSGRTLTGVGEVYTPRPYQRQSIFEHSPTPSSGDKAGSLQPSEYRHGKGMNQDTGGGDTAVYTIELAGLFRAEGSALRLHLRHQRGQRRSHAELSHCAAQGMANSGNEEAGPLGAADGRCRRNKPICRCLLDGARSKPALYVARGQSAGSRRLGRARVTPRHEVRPSQTSGRQPQSLRPR